MDYRQIKEVGIIYAVNDPFDGKELFPLAYEVPGGYRFYLIVNEELERFNPANSDCSKASYEEEAGNESQFENMLQVLLKGRLVKSSSKEKGRVNLVQQYDTHAWIKYWSENNQFKKVDDQAKNLGLIEALPAIMSGNSGCFVHVGTCNCGIPSCYAYSVLVLPGHGQSFSVPMLIKSDAGMMSAICTDLQLFLNKENQEESEGRAPYLRELQENGLCLQPENYFRLPAFF